LVPVQLILHIGGEEAAGGFTKEFSEFSQLGLEIGEFHIKAR